MPVNDRRIASDRTKPRRQPRVVLVVAHRLQRRERPAAGQGMRPLPGVAHQDPQRRSSAIPVGGSSAIQQQMAATGSRRPGSRWSPGADRGCLDPANGHPFPLSIFHSIHSIPFHAMVLESMERSLTIPASLAIPPTHCSGEILWPPDPCVQHHQPAQPPPPPRADLTRPDPASVPSGPEKAPASTCSVSTRSTRPPSRPTFPAFRAGDTVRGAREEVIEGTRSRIQVFRGLVIRRHGGGVERDLHRPNRSPGVVWSGPSAYHPDHRSQDRVVTRGDVRRMPHLPWSARKAAAHPRASRHRPTDADST